MGDWPERWIDLPLVVVDVETTGFDERVDHIIEVGMIRFEGGEVVDKYGQLVNPGRSIPSEVTELTGITEDDVADAPPFSNIAHTVYEKLQGVGIGAYNLSFDRKFLRTELMRSGLEWPNEAPTFDPLIFARQFFKTSKKKNLATIAELLDLDLKEAHRATHDAEVAGQILYAFENKLPSSLDDLLVLQSQWEAAQAQEMSKWRNFDTSMSTINEVPVGLGPAYVYGDEMDPLRALYLSVPEAKK